MKTRIKYKYICLLISVLGIPHLSSAQSTNQNYILTRTFTSNGVNGAKDSLDVIQYFDGLGRPIETVQKKVTPNMADLVSYQEYDGFGRESNTWLPVVASNNNGAFVGLNDFKSKVTTTYNSTTYNSVADTKPYSYPVYEASPLNRIEKQFGAGQNWHSNSKAVETKYLTNNAGYPCAYYSVSGDNLVKNGNYANSQLYVTQTTGEDGNVVYEFKDKLGRVVLQRQINENANLDTYFVYDDFNNLRFMLPPLASDSLTSNTSWNMQHRVLNNYAYAYLYDARNRCIEKKIPGADSIYCIYDKADRLIFSQTGEQRKEGVWSFTVPDVFGRTVLTGTCKNALTHSPNPLENIVVTASRTNTTNSLKGYAMNGISLNIPSILTVNYYDDYKFMGTNEIPAATDTDFQYETNTGYGERYSGNNGYEYNGLLTGTIVAYNWSPELVKIHIPDSATSYTGNLGIISDSPSTKAPAKLYDTKSLADNSEQQKVAQVAQVTSAPDASNSNDKVALADRKFLGAVMYYDYKSRLVQSKSQNHLGGVEKEYISYNFTGQPTQKKHVHSATGKPAQTEVYSYTYDHAGRLTESKHKLNNDSEVILANNVYDELGRLKSSQANNNSKLKTEYKYNIRSWINKISNTNFYEELAYTYGGNIATMKWGKTAVSSAHYTFTYDNLSQLKTASYSPSSTSAYSPGNYSTAYSYDRHGNIKTIQRYGLVSSIAIEDYTGDRDTASIIIDDPLIKQRVQSSAIFGDMYGLVDNLVLTYRGNRLFNINDTGTDPIGQSFDFKEYANGSSMEYTYNANGAMTKDLNKGITQITYNEQNLPKTLIIENEQVNATNEFTYTATGAKLKVVHRWQQTPSNLPARGTLSLMVNTDEVKTTDYVGNKIYENGVLKKILTENGYYEDGIYYFYVRDHLGNNRIVANQTGNIVQQNQYYPFGMSFGSTGQELQPYKYNGKELDMMHGLNIYDSFARSYDPASGRFTTPDPLAEKYPHISPYAFCLNNPLRYKDPDGRNPIVIVGGVALGGGELILISTGVITTGYILSRTQSGSIGFNPSSFSRSGKASVNTIKPSPGLTNQQKREREAKEKLDKNQAQTAKDIDKNITGDMPDGNPSPKRDPKGNIGAVVIGAGLGAAVAESIIEGTEPQETATPQGQEPPQQPEIKQQEQQQQQKNNSLWQNFLDIFR